MDTKFGTGRIEGLQSLKDQLDEIARLLKPGERVLIVDKPDSKTYYGRHKNGQPYVEGWDKCTFTRWRNRFDLSDRISEES